MFEQLQKPKTRQVHSGHVRGNVAAKKNYARGRGSEYPPSSRVRQPHSQAPLPMISTRVWQAGSVRDQEFSLAELVADGDKEQKNWDCRDYFPKHVVAARQNVSQTFP